MPHSASSYHRRGDPPPPTPQPEKKPIDPTTLPSIFQDLIGRLNLGGLTNTATSRGTSDPIKRALEELNYTTTSPFSRFL